MPKVFRYLLSYEWEGYVILKKFFIGCKSKGKKCFFLVQFRILQHSIQKLITAAPSESAEQEASSENVESTDKGMSSVIWILVVVIIIGIAVVIWLLKKKGKNSES